MHIDIRSGNKQKIKLYEKKTARSVRAASQISELNVKWEWNFSV